MLPCGLESTTVLTSVILLLLGGGNREIADRSQIVTKACGFTFLVWTSIVPAIPCGPALAELLPALTAYQRSIRAQILMQLVIQL